MKRFSQYWIPGLAIAVSAALGIQLAHAQAPSADAAERFPLKPVRIVIPVPPGGIQDALARGIAVELTKAWGQPVLVENRPGATGVIAAEHVARSAPDGYTIFQSDSVNLMTNQFLRRNLPYDAVRDFTPVIGLVHTGGEVLVARAQLPAKNAQELVALARGKPGTLNYGSFGIGSAAHVGAEKFGLAAGIKATHIPYKGGGDIAKALLAGEIDFAFTGVPGVLPLIRQDRIRALAFSGLQRSPALPDVSTLLESGYSVETGSWFGWFVPAATPKAIVDRISAEAGRTLESHAFRDKFVLGVGLEPLNVQAAPFGDLVKETREKYSALFKTLQIKLE